MLVQKMLEYFVTNVGKLQSIMLRKKCWQHFQKMLMKNVGNAPKNVDEKMLTTV
jgi:hypothetical protein